MLLKYFADNLWLTLGVWAIVYFADYALTVVGARLYYSGVEQHEQHQTGYELNPFFQQDINQQQKFSARFLAMLGACSLIIAFAWGMFAKLYPPAFHAILGFFLLPELLLLPRHLHSICLSNHIRASKGIRGKVEYAAWLIYQGQSISHLALTGLWLLIYFITGSPFFLGGVVAELWYAWHAYRCYRYYLAKEPATMAEEAQPVEEASQPEEATPEVS